MSTDRSPASSPPEAVIPTPTRDNGWGVACWTCGHPATMHGKTFCLTRAGASDKRPCDCDGYKPAGNTASQPPEEGSP